MNYCIMPHSSCTMLLVVCVYSAMVPFFFVCVCLLHLCERFICCHPCVFVPDTTRWDSSRCDEAQAVLDFQPSISECFRLIDELL